MSNFFKTLEQKKEEYLASKNVESLAVLYRLESYIESGRYSKVKKASQFFALRNLKAKEVGAILGISAETVKRTRFTLSCDAWNAVGRNFFSLLDSGKYSECNSVLDYLLGDSKLSSVIPNGIKPILDSIATEDDRAILKTEQQPSSFVEEINFLVTISEPYIRAKTSNLNVGRLLYLMGVLDGSVGTRADHVGLVNYIMEKAGEEL